MNLKKICLLNDPARTGPNMITTILPKEANHMVLKQRNRIPQLPFKHLQLLIQYKFSFAMCCKPTHNVPKMVAIKTSMEHRLACLPYHASCPLTYQQLHLMLVQQRVLGWSYRETHLFLFLM